MRLATTALAAALLFIPTLPALADAVTYKGTIGNIPVVVELSADPSGPGAEPFGRYFYPGKGIDIPLTFMQAEPGLVVLHEEGPCTETTCATDENGKVLEPPFGALWQLNFDGVGAILTGAWQANGPLLEVRLERVAAREFADDGSGPEGLTFAARDALWTGDPVTMETAPYDVLKMQAVTYKEAPAVAFEDGSSVLYVADPRTVFAFPRIAGLAGDADAAAANAFLEQRHWAMNADALACAAKQYPSMGWDPLAAISAGGLGYWDEEQVEVTYLSPMVMSWTESGSLFCGGAYPHNHHDVHNLDVRTGAPLDLGRIFADWPALTDYVLANRTPGDAEREAECGTEELIRSNLNVSFQRGDRLLFGLGELPHVIMACGDDVWETTLADLPEKLLAPTASDYFPSLAD